MCENLRVQLASGEREDAAFGHVEQAAGALLRIDPVADFEKCELEETQVDDVALVFADLYAIPGGERTTPEDEKPAGEIGEWILESDGDPGGDEPEESRNRSG